jgi:hypothetical protein
MRAVICRAWGEPEGLAVEHVAPPTPGPVEVVIDVKATGMNYADAIMVAGRYQTRPAFPFSPGLETAGTVARCGTGVARFNPGDRVMAILAHGGFAEQAVAPEGETFAMPGSMPFDEAGAFPVTYVSSHPALRWQARLEAGETLLGRPERPLAFIVDGFDIGEADDGRLVLTLQFGAAGQLNFGFEPEDAETRRPRSARAASSRHLPDSDPSRSALVVFRPSPPLPPDQKRKDTHPACDSFAASSHLLFVGV